MKRAYIIKKISRAQAINNRRTRENPQYMEQEQL